MPTNITDGAWYDAAELVVHRLADYGLLPGPVKAVPKSYANVQVRFRGEWLDVAHEDAGEAGVSTYPAASVMYVSGITTGDPEPVSRTKW